MTRFEIKRQISAAFAEIDRQRERIAELKCKECVLLVTERIGQSRAVAIEGELDDSKKYYSGWDLIAGTAVQVIEHETKVPEVIVAFGTERHRVPITNVFIL